MKIVLYGGAGFIGSELADYFLARGHVVTIADAERRVARLQNLNPELFKAADVWLTDTQQSLPVADVLVHLAWTTTPATSMSDIEKDIEDNIISSVCLFREAVQRGIGKIIFCSSGGAVYGNAGRKVIESRAPSPVSAYGINKLCVERYLDVIAQSSGMPAVSLRLANPYGSYQLRGTPIGAIATFLRNIQAGEPIRLWGDGEIRRDYIHVYDVCAAFDRVISSSTIQSGVYNVGTGESRSLNEIVSRVSAATGKTAAVEFLSARDFDVSEISLDASKLTCVTGWLPEISLEQGINEVYESGQKILASRP
ncbi:MAG: NAD-dependent epimerase/dehydratase family protein [Lysobacterales bacterium]